MKTGIFNGIVDGSRMPLGFTPKELAQPVVESARPQGRSAAAWLMIMVLALAAVIGLGCLVTKVAAPNNWQKGQREWISTHQL